MAEPPSILIVDDDPEQLRDQIALQLTDGATTDVVHPSSIEMSDLERSDLVLVDYRLEMWNERDTQPVISLRPQTGLALTVLLREQVDRANKNSLTAFALHSGHLSDIQGRLPSGTVAQVLARLNNLEWVFSKEEPRRYDQMVRLARAVRMLPRDWPQDSGCAASMVRELLAIGDSGSSERCWRDVQECRVPVHELTAGAHGLLFVRWLLHQVLPYPTFLWEMHWVAARLRVPVETLRRILAGTSRLARDLRCMRYSGILSGFLGDRWWRGAIEDYVWELAGGRGAEAHRLRERLAQRAEMELHPLRSDPVVVCLDAGLEPTGELLSPTDAVTLRPDHWPTFADSAWVDVETVRDNPNLQFLLDPFDQDRIRPKSE